MDTPKTIYTIGYSGYNNYLDPFIDELIKRKIDVLIDVRSQPYSNRFNLFNKETLERALKTKHITYRNYSEEFGAKQLDHKYYSTFDGVDERIDYQLFTKSEKFTNGLKKIAQIYANHHTVVIMCSEKDPITCHRAIMISKVLSNTYNYHVLHITPNAVDETQPALEARMQKTIKDEVLKKRHLNVLEEKMKTELQNRTRPSLFQNNVNDYSENIENYYRILNAKIGWKYNEVLGYQ